MPSAADIWGIAPPSLLIALTMDAATAKAALEGVPGSRILASLGAVWMLARLRLELFRPVLASERLDVTVSERKTELSTMRRVSGLRIGGEAVGFSDMAFVLVSRETRVILRPSAAASLWDRPEHTEKLPPLKRLKLAGEMDFAGKYTVRASQCDFNGHLSSAAYADCVCDMCGLWENEPRYVRLIRIDYNAECPPGSVLDVYCRREGSASLCRGLLSGKRVSFLARIEHDRCRAADYAP